MLEINGDKYRLKRVYNTPVQLKLPQVLFSMNFETLYEYTCLPFQKSSIPRVFRLNFPQLKKKKKRITEVREDISDGSQEVETVSMVSGPPLPTNCADLLGLRPESPEWTFTRKIKRHFSHFSTKVFDPRKRSGPFGSKSKHETTEENRNLCNLTL